MSDLREINQISQHNKQLDRDKASWDFFNSRAGTHGRSSLAALFAVFGIAFGAFHFAKADFFLAPVLGAVLGLCVGWGFGWCLSRAWGFFTVTLPVFIKYLVIKIFRSGV